MMALVKIHIKSIVTIELTWWLLFPMSLISFLKGRKYLIRTSESDLEWCRAECGARLAGKAGLLLLAIGLGTYVHNSGGVIAGLWRTTVHCMASRCVWLAFICVL